MGGMGGRVFKRGAGCRFSRCLSSREIQDKRDPWENSQIRHPGPCVRGSRPLAAPQPSIVVYQTITRLIEIRSKKIAFRGPTQPLLLVPSLIHDFCLRGSAISGDRTRSIEAKTELMRALLEDANDTLNRRVGNGRFHQPAGQASRKRTLELWDRDGRTGGTTGGSDRAPEFRGRLHWADAGNLEARPCRVLSKPNLTFGATQAAKTGMDTLYLFTHHVCIVGNHGHCASPPISRPMQPRALQRHGVSVGKACKQGQQARTPGSSAMERWKGTWKAHAQGTP